MPCPYPHQTPAGSVTLRALDHREARVVPSVRAAQRSGVTQNAEKVGRYGYGQQHATPFCISEYLRNRPRAGGTTSQGAKLDRCHVKIASSGANHKPNPTGGAEGSEISGLPKAGKRTKTQRFRKKGVLEGLHKEGRRRGGCETVRC